ncbi:MAG: UbiA family prenyltransferase [Deltaproteobacteria bacterium]|nr:UbiA family prenyltransferase [Deltaproteobacteria bacterium]
MNMSTAMKLGRISNLPTVWSNVLAGAILAGGTPTVGVIVPLGLMGSLLYVAGMFLNDVFDASIDARERPERPIPSGEVERGEVIRWAVVMVLAALAIAWSMGWRPGLAAVGLVACIIAYDRHHKGNAAAPVLMGMCRAGLYLCGALAVAPGLGGPVLLGAAILVAYVLGLTYAAAHESSSRLVRVGPLLGIWAPAVVALPLLGAGPSGAGLLLGFAGWVTCALRLVRSRRPASIRRGVISLIAGIALVDALLIATAVGFGPVVVAFAAFLTTLALQRLVAGT